MRDGAGARSRRKPASPSVSNCEVTAARALAARQAALKSPGNCAIISSAHRSPVASLHRLVSSGWPGSSQRGQSAVTRGEAHECLLSDSVPPSPSPDLSAPQIFTAHQAGGTLSREQDSTTPQKTVSCPFSHQPSPARVPPSWLQVPVAPFCTFYQRSHTV